MGEQATQTRDTGPDIFSRHADFCGCFANPTRLRLLWALAEGEKTVSQLAAELELPLAAISQQLRVLRNKLAVRTRKQGRAVHYRVANDKFIRGARLIREGLVEELRMLGNL